MSAARRERGAEDAGTVVSPERLLTFGDAVFAIAITLLALDINVPDGLPDADLGGALNDALADVSAFLLSFVVIGALWLAQYAVLSRIVRIDMCLLYLYLALLALIAGLPFPTRLISEYGDTALATAVYAGAIALASGLITAMSLRILLRPTLVEPGVPRASLSHSVREGLVMVVVFAVSIPLTLVSARVAQLWWLAAVPLRVWLGRWPGAARPSA
ncbi:TMEM175 family protein [Streptomyces sp. NBC_01619]|uniref:TMEM175 family protein n=1 Tax=Streptomyces pratisoli TaxID=3139917 RepID=A0ACC6QBS8_9ACTN|nr:MULTISPECIES: TMEM175 family protein [unclassified Streptomyces]MCX4510520.1 TMEM175 family protein [Streptomyces sp. NBC_01619]